MCRASRTPTYSGSVYCLAKFLRINYEKAAPAAMIAASNFFEFAVAVTITLFGVFSPAALSPVVGVLEEVPIMILLVAISKRTRHIFVENISLHEYRELAVNLPELVPLEVCCVSSYPDVLHVEPVESRKPPKADKTCIVQCPGCRKLYLSRLD